MKVISGYREAAFPKKKLEYFLLNGIPVCSKDGEDYLHLGKLLITLSKMYNNNENKCLSAMMILIYTRKKTGTRQQKETILSG